MATQHPVGHEAIVGTLDLPILGFRLPAEIDLLHQAPAWTGATGPSSATLVKHANLRIVLVAMRQGTRMPEHHTGARLTVHNLQGRIRMLLPNGARELAPGELLVLDRNLVHDVEALDDSAFLLTLAWPSEEDCR